MCEAPDKMKKMRNPSSQPDPTFVFKSDGVAITAVRFIYPTLAMFTKCNNAGVPPDRLSTWHNKSAEETENSSSQDEPTDFNTTENNSSHDEQTDFNTTENVGSDSTLLFTGSQEGKIVGWSLKVS